MTAQHVLAGVGGFHREGLMLTSLKSARPILILSILVALYTSVRAMSAYQEWRRAQRALATGLVEELPAEIVDDLPPGTAGPHPSFAADEVVRRQLRALRDDPSPAGGVAACFALASPSNRAVTGPLSGFARIVREAPYDALLHPRSTLVGRPHTLADYARVMVTLVDEHDRMRLFQFELTRQSRPPFVDCWMTDGVTEVEIEDRDEEPGTEDAKRPADEITATRFRPPAEDA